jgi:hypothetical protein
MQEATRKANKKEWPIAGQDQERVDERVGFYERSIQIDAKGFQLSGFGIRLGKNVGQLCTSIVAPSGTGMSFQTARWERTKPVPNGGDLIYLLVPTLRSDLSKP